MVYIFKGILEKEAKLTEFLHNPTIKRQDKQGMYVFVYLLKQLKTDINGINLIFEWSFLWQCQFGNWRMLHTGFGSCNLLFSSSVTLRLAVILELVPTCSSYVYLNPHKGMPLPVMRNQLSSH